MRGMRVMRMLSIVVRRAQCSTLMPCAACRQARCEHIARGRIPWAYLGIAQHG